MTLMPNGLHTECPTQIEQNQGKGSDWHEVYMLRHAYGFRLAVRLSAGLLGRGA